MQERLSEKDDRSIQRELRSMRHHAVVLIGSIAMGVAAMTAIHALADLDLPRISDQSRPMLAGDVEQSMHHLPDEFA